MKEYVITALGKPGGIFDPETYVLFDSKTNLIGSATNNYTIANQTNAKGVFTISTSNLRFTNTADKNISQYCYTHGRNETPIDLRSYRYLNITFKDSYTFYNAQPDEDGTYAGFNRIQIRINPVVGKPFSQGESITDFYTGTNAFSREIHNESGTMKIDLSKYTNTSATFRIYWACVSGGYIDISKVTLTKN